MEPTGAMLVGRGTYEVGKRMAAEDTDYDDYDGGPVFVLTHRPPDEPDLGATFRTCDLGEAVATARVAAGGKDLEILGDGVRFSTSGLGRIDLEPFGNTRSGPVTMLRFRVRRSDGAAADLRD